MWSFRLVIHLVIVVFDQVLIGSWACLVFTVVRNFYLLIKYLIINLVDVSLITLGYHSYRSCTLKYIACSNWVLINNLIDWSCCQFQIGLARKLPREDLLIWLYIMVLLKLFSLNLTVSILLFFLCCLLSLLLKKNLMLLPRMDHIHIVASSIHSQEAIVNESRNELIFHLIQLAIFLPHIGQLLSLIFQLLLHLLLLL